MRKPILEKPLSIGSVEPGVLKALSEISPGWIESATWSVHSGGRNNPKVLAILGEVTERLIEVTRERGNTLSYIMYDIDNHTVPVGGQQRDIGWHLDQSKGTAMLVADTLPTEFLVKGSQPIGSGALPCFTVDTIVNSYINQDIENNVFDVYQPDPYEMVLMTDHVHRSPYNNTKREMARTWLRAFLVCSD